MSRLGKNIRFRPEGYDRPVTGEVIWVHPKRRFVLVRYRVPTLLIGDLSKPLVECRAIICGKVDTGL